MRESTAADRLTPVCNKGYREEQVPGCRPEARLLAVLPFLWRGSETDDVVAGRTLHDGERLLFQHHGVGGEAGGTAASNAGGGSRPQPAQRRLHLRDAAACAGADLGQSTRGTGTARHL